MNPAISRAVTIFRKSPAASDDEIFRELVSNGIERATAARLVEFLLMAYCRLVLADMGTRFSDHFQRRQLDGSLSQESALVSDPLWQEIFSFAVTEKQRVVAGKDLLAIAVHGSEFDAVNQLLKQGAKAGDIVLTTPVFSWPEDGP